MNIQDIRQGRTNTAMRLWDIRQGRQIDAQHVIDELRRFAITGPTNTAETRETMRQAAVLLEQAMGRGPLMQAVMVARGGIDDEDGRTATGLLMEE